MQIIVCDEGCCFVYSGCNTNGHTFGGVGELQMTSQSTYVLLVRTMYEFIFQLVVHTNGVLFQCLFAAYT